MWFIKKSIIVFCVLFLAQSQLIKAQTYYYELYRVTNTDGLPVEIKKSRGEYFTFSGDIIIENSDENGNIKKWEMPQIGSTTYKFSGQKNADGDLIYKHWENGRFDPACPGFFCSRPRLLVSPSGMYIMEYSEDQKHKATTTWVRSEKPSSQFSIPR